MTSFPDGFLFGAATSSHQVEGGQTRSDWSDWEAQPGRIHDGSTRGDACAWWSGRAEEDLALAKSLGHNAHRLSLEWSRLEPAPGKYDQNAFDRYTQILEKCEPLKLTPMVTLHHFTLPRWAADAGGWLSRETADRFSHYAAECVKRLGSHVDLWATLNEPSVLALMGYVLGQWPPGSGGLLSALRAVAGQIRGHSMARKAIQSISPGTRVGLVINAPLLEPASTSLLDRAAAFVQWAGFNGWYLPALRGEVDWIGVNYYGRYRVAFDPSAPALGRHVQEQSIRTAHGDWGQICPRGLTRRLLELSDHGVPLYVTENGVLDNDDSLRPSVIRGHLDAVRDAISRGADVRGYFHWSLIDNFEWAEGYAAKFGLVEVDRATQARRPRESAQVYKRAIEDALFRGRTPRE